MRLAIIVAVALILNGCAPIDPEKLIGGTKGTAVPAPQKLDCNLISPASTPESVAP